MNTKTCPKTVIVADLDFLVKTANVDYTAVFVTRSTYEELKKFSKLFNSADQILANIKTENVLEKVKMKSMILSLNQAENEVLCAYKILCNNQSETEVKIATGSSKLQRFCYRNNIPVIEAEVEDKER